MMVSSVHKRLLYTLLYFKLFLQLSNSYMTLDIGLTYDDYLVREVFNYTSNGGWNNGDIMIENSTTGSIYHGPFDDYTVGQVSILSREVRVANFGFIRVNFTLIFACDVLNFTDDVDLHFDRDAQAKEYYWIDTYSHDYSTNNYPYMTPHGFTIQEYYDPLLLDPDFCTNNMNGIGDDVSWAIYDSYLSPRAYKPGDTFIIAFTGRFNHFPPYDTYGKFWAVTDIIFELIHVETDYPTLDPTSYPTNDPTIPTQLPSQSTINPTTHEPTITTNSPTSQPTTSQPTNSPSNSPTTSQATTSALHEQPTTYTNNPTNVPITYYTNRTSHSQTNSTKTLSNSQSTLFKWTKFGDKTIIIALVILGIVTVCVFCLSYKMKRKMYMKRAQYRESSLSDIVAERKIHDISYVLPLKNGSIDMNQDMNVEKLEIDDVSVEIDPGARDSDDRMAQKSLLLLQQQIIKMTRIDTSDMDTKTNSEFCSVKTECSENIEADTNLKRMISELHLDGLDVSSPTTILHMSSILSTPPADEAIFMHANKKEYDHDRN